MISDVQQWLDNPAANFGWIMLGNENAGQTAKRFGGQSTTSPETPPQLSIQYIAPWIWTGGTGNAAWTSSANWTSGSSASEQRRRRSCWVIPVQAAAPVDLLAAAPSVSHVTFEPGRAVTVTSTAAGGGSLTLDNGGSPAALAVSGSGELIGAAVAVRLNSDAYITTSGSADSLTIAGDVGNGSAAHGIEKDGPGTLILAGDNTYWAGRRSSTVR